MGPAVLALLLSTQPPPAPTEGCACIPAPGPQARLARAEAAFLATAVHGGWLEGEIAFTDFEIEPGPLAAQLRLLPGQTRVRVRHSTDLNGPGCGVRFELLGRYLVLVSQSRRDGVWETSACLMPDPDGAEDGIAAAFEAAQQSLQDAHASVQTILQDVETGRADAPEAAGSADVAGAVGVETGPDR